MTVKKSAKHPQSEQEAYDTHFLIAPEPEGNYRLYVNFESNTFSLEVTFSELERLSKQLNEFIDFHGRQRAAKAKEEVQK